MKARHLRELLNKPGIISTPGAYDVWSARLVEKAGFPAVYMTGYGAAVSVIGQPDIGLITMTEMAIHAKNIASAVDIPLIADADNGYGGVLNVIRTVQEYERGGVAAVQIEDQVFPKRCGHMEGKELIPIEEMIAKVRASVHARKSEDLVIIARTDARAVNGFDDAIRRSLAYADAGADVIFFEAPQSVEEMREVAKTISTPLLANMVEKGKTPLLSKEELERLGYKIVIYPASLLYAATKSVIELLQNLREDGSTENCLEEMVAFSEFYDMVGVPEARELEKSFFDEASC